MKHVREMRRSPFLPGGSSCLHSVCADQVRVMSILWPKPVRLTCPLCRVRVSQDGQFLHYVFPYQFLDSPEWESLRPSEEGTFQVSPHSRRSSPASLLAALLHV